MAARKAKSNPGKGKKVASRPSRSSARAAVKARARSLAKPVVKSVVRSSVVRSIVKPVVKSVSKARSKATATAKMVIRLRPPIRSVIAIKAPPLKVPKNGKAAETAFKRGDFVVYPTHGVGKVIEVETCEIAGHKLDLIVIAFDRDRMTLRVPVDKAETSGLRRLSTRKMMDTALTTLKGRARVKRTMWSRRAQEYEAKINSGDPISIAEVVRDLHRSAGQPDQSFSERQIYEAARDRLANELAAVERVDVATATRKLETLLTT